MGNHLHKLMIIYQLVMGSAVLYNVEMNNVRLALLYDQYVASRPIEMTNGSALGLEVSGVDKDQVSFFTSYCNAFGERTRAAPSMPSHARFVTPIFHPCHMVPALMATMYESVTGTTSWSEDT